MSCTYQQKTKLLWAGTPASRCHPWDLNRPCLHAGEQQLCSWQQKRLPASAVMSTLQCSAGCSHQGFVLALSVCYAA